MRVAIATVQVPFISGGAELMTQGLCNALRSAGHEIELVAMPFRFGPPAAVRATMDAWQAEDFDRFDCGPVDHVIALKFPAFYLQHHAKTVWLMHQHRSVYELYDTPYGDQSSNAEAAALREDIALRDTSALKQTRRVFTISPTVTERLRHYNGIDSRPLLQPPAHAELFRAAEAMPYIFVPSRLETLKRQELLIRAMPLVSEPVFAVIAGDGGQRDRLVALVAELGMTDRVRFLGRIDDATMRTYYAHALGVFFGPLMEDYGFITLEAMLAARPVITCRDSGGPTHFVRHGETGLITEPDVEAVAAAINRLWADRTHARLMGRQGRQLYDEMGISWDAVVNDLLAD